MEDLDNQTLMDLLQSVDERSAEAFDKFLAPQPEPVAEAPAVAEAVAATVVVETPVENAEATAVKVEAEAAVPAETETNMDTTVSIPPVNGGETIAATPLMATEVKIEEKPPKTSVELLIEILTEWKKANTSEEEKRQNNRRNRERNQKKTPRPGPNEEKLKEILKRTGYSHEVSSGQRKYGGPPPDWPTSNANGGEVVIKKEEETVGTDAKQPSEIPADAEMNDEAKPNTNGNENGHKEESSAEASNSQTNGTSNATAAAAGATPAAVQHPGAGCECFVGKLPRDLFEDELIPVFEQQGRIWDLRLMIDPGTGFSKGYCFVTYCDKESAAQAAKNVNFFEFFIDDDGRLCLFFFLILFSSTQK
jgi:hypothetical protein